MLHKTWKAILLFAAFASDGAHAQANFYYISIDKETLVPVTEESIRMTPCWGKLDKKESNEILKLLPLSEIEPDKVDPQRIRLLIVADKWRFAMDKDRNFRMNQSRGALSVDGYSELFRILRAHFGKGCEYENRL